MCLLLKIEIFKLIFGSIHTQETKVHLTFRFMGANWIIFMNHLLLWHIAYLHVHNSDINCAFI